MSPSLATGSCHVDARGTLSFVNDFSFQGVDRFYWVKAGQAEVLRGWVGHRRDHKWFSVVHGEVMIAIVQPDDWQSPSRSLPVVRYLLAASRPQVLHVPPWPRHRQHQPGCGRRSADLLLRHLRAGQDR